MDLRADFEDGLRPEAFAVLIPEDQESLHALHDRRANVDEAAVASVRAAGAERGLVITEPWCGDSLAVLPVVLALFRRVGCEVRIARRDEHPELIDAFLTRGGRAIPIVLVLDDVHDVRLRWGPRPGPAQRIVEEHREDVAAGGIERAEVHKRVRRFYAADRGKTIVAELVAGLRA